MLNLYVPANDTFDRPVTRRADPSPSSRHAAGVTSGLSFPWRTHASDGRAILDARGALIALVGTPERDTDVARMIAAMIVAAVNTVAGHPSRDDAT